MSTEFLAVTSLFALRLGVPLLVLLALGALLGGLNSRRENTPVE